MPDSFDNSFKIYVDPMNAGEGGMDRGDAADVFSTEVANVKEDMKNVEQLYQRLQEANEEVKEAQNAKTMKELRAHLITDLDYLLKLAKQINRKFDGLVMLNAAQRRLAGSGVGSEDDRTRASMISDLAEDLKRKMLSFQGLRVQMESDHRQLIDSRYFAITREKATSEAIDNLITSQSPDTPLHHVIQEHGRGAVAEVVAEIQERRDTLKDIRRSLMDLHQIFLGTATPVEMNSSGNRVGGGPPSPVGPANPAPSVPPQPAPAPGKAAAAAVAHHAAAKLGTGTGGLNDYEKETRKQAYIAIALALVIILAIIIALLKIENSLESEMT